jgi:hypothetical protein
MSNVHAIHTVGQFIKHFILNKVLIMTFIIANFKNRSLLQLLIGYFLNTLGLILNTSPYLVLSICKTENKKTLQFQQETVRHWRIMNIDI